MEFGRQGANATAEEIDGLLRMERFAGQGVGAESPNQGPTALAPSPLSPQYSTHYLADTGWIHLTLVDGRWTKRQVTDLCVLGGLPPRTLNPQVFGFESRGAHFEKPSSSRYLARYLGGSLTTDSGRDPLNRYA
jgi:hypothetical protein